MARKTQRRRRVARQQEKRTAEARRRWDRLLARHNAKARAGQAGYVEITTLGPTTVVEYIHDAPNRRSEN